MRTAELNRQYQQTIQPVSLIRWLWFEVLSSQFNNPGGFGVVEVIQLNNLYDLLLSILTNAVKYYNLQMSLYDLAKVLKIAIKYVLDNLEQFAMDASFFVSPTNPSTTFSSKNAVENMIGSGSHIWSDTMSEQYGKKSQITMNKTIQLPIIAGNPAKYISSDTYASRVSSGPSETLYGALVVSSSGSTMPNGFTSRLQIGLKVKFYQMKLDNSSNFVEKTDAVIDHVEENLPPHVQLIHNGRTRMGIKVYRTSDPKAIEVRS